MTGMSVAGMKNFHANNSPQYLKTAISSLVHEKKNSFGFKVNSVLQRIMIGEKKIEEVKLQSVLTRKNSCETWP